MAQRQGGLTYLEGGSGRKLSEPINLESIQELETPSMESMEFIEFMEARDSNIALSGDPASFAGSIALPRSAQERAPHDR